MESLPSAEKFILPHGGLMSDDPEYRALDETEELKLPFPTIAIEYWSSWSHSKFPFQNVLLAQESTDQILCCTATRCMEPIGGTTAWYPPRMMKMPRVGYLNRAVPKERHLNKSRVPIIATAEDDGTVIDWRNLNILLCFINILRCSNVHSEVMPPKVDRRPPCKRRKDPLPFDTYHILTVDVPGKPGVTGAGLGGSHRSPREHLRRGHIRRLDSGARIWVNACVVAAGKGAGVVRKDYALQPA